ncbi:tyrosine-protein phosphatase YwqE [Wenyingzhuangia heitensis]|uniref:protein-tyrosine-phosphatase n=1 Tax=Wenyingzhuangia heitensis TaxID=1487859 RepID=A0ABX0UA76_9FLAO|nr:CpsB/CapC family capsule biosynthesis tyrosine phosphatase [Wenyingzhuangia heitensis]NIJ45724.1 tyrosine-protein phosphatase YwqE [Wenyingzhuangia heitensis]
MGLFNKKININELYPVNYVDIHSHLLPGIDDGAKDIEDSIALIEKLYAFGIKQFRTTPHVLGDVWENSSATIKEKEALLQAELKERGYHDIQISASAEYMMDNNFSKLLTNDDILTLKGKYVLVEMSFFNAPFNLDDILFQIQIKGYTPVLAHPERYAFYHKDFSEYQKLIDAGCLFQLNILSLTPQYGKEITKTAQRLLKEGMYTFVGSDTHHKRHVKLMETLANQKTKKLLTPLFENNIKEFSF